ncbi:MAG TPA: response regulator transcription factor [Nitratifractor sp.]|nr:response regulator transcription factor [Nitratifractor sp.]
MKKKILLLEDDKLYNETLQDFLEDEGYSVESVYDPYSAYDKTYSNHYDLYLFDINLPFEDGIEALGNLRSANDETPTIFITSRDDKESLLRGFSVGADDYIRKPVDLDELLLRIKAVLYRVQKENITTLGEYRLDREKKDLYKGAEAEHLGLKPFLLLDFFLLHDTKALSLEEIYRAVWRDEEPSNGALRVYIAKLKKYFPNAIEVIRGYGYRFESSKI